MKRNARPARPKPRRAPRPRVDVQYACGRSRLPERSAIRRWVRAAMADLPARDWELVVRIVDEEEGAMLNRRYRRKRGPTNVLSFRYDATPGELGSSLGDIVICAPVVAREARDQGKTRAAHWAHMVVHGVMHLRGFDHVRVRDAAVMEAAETRILERLGFPNPYS